MRIVTEATVQAEMAGAAARGSPTARFGAGDIAEAERRQLAEQVTKAVRRATDGLKNELRGQVRAAGLGTAVANAWRGEVFPRQGVSAGAAGYIYSRAPAIHGAFSAGGTVVAKGPGFGGGRAFLAIPTANAPALGVGGKRITPETWPEGQYGALELEIRGGRPVLVANVIAGKAGGWRRNTAGRRRQGRAAQEVVMFILVPQVSLKKTLDPDTAFARWATELEPDLRRDEG